MMRTRIQAGIWTIATAFVLGGVALGAKTTTLTGRVSDAMCGAKHTMAGSDAECTRACVKKGSDY